MSVSEHARFRRAAVDARRSLEEFGDLAHVERPQGGSGLGTHAGVQCSYSNLLLLAYVVMFFPFMMGSLGAKRPTLTQTQPNEVTQTSRRGVLSKEIASMPAPTPSIGPLRALSCFFFVRPLPFS